MVSTLTFRKIGPGQIIFWTNAHAAGVELKILTRFVRFDNLSQTTSLVHEQVLAKNTERSFVTRTVSQKKVIV